MKRPSRLYRFRPLEPGHILQRELAALHNSYLFAPPFKSMNDPMEAFYETGGHGDHIVDAMLSLGGKGTSAMYDLLDETIAKFALVSFTGTYQALPLWAYYASNFAGMCLEFDTSRLMVGDFQNEKLRPVTYAKTALPPMGIADLAPERLEDFVVSRITRKRAEWAHEREWRVVTGEVGRKHYLDDALTRVFLGPRVHPGHAHQICEALIRRPVEVLQGEIRVFDLAFSSLQGGMPFRECERIGAGKFDPAEALYAVDDLRSFLKVPIERLVEACREMALRPNLEEVVGVDLSTQNSSAIYVNAVHKLRSGRHIYEKQLFNNRMRPIESVT